METTFTLGESSEDVLENVCFMVLKIKKRRANTKIGATLVVMGTTLGSTNQKAGFRSRGTNVPISVQQKVM